MKEPDPRSSRLVFAAGLAALAAAGGLGFVLGRQTAPAPPPPASPVVAPAATPPAATPSPTVERVLDRAALIALAAAAADATARGAALPEAAGAAVGARFSVAIPFGCGGALAEGDASSAGWRYDPVGQALRVQVPATRWAPADWWPTEPPASLETIEGFWVPRPWTASETCSAAAPVAAAGSGIEAVTLPGETLAIAQAFTRDGARSERRDDKPYVAVVRTSPDAVRTARGFRLRLVGRLASIADGPALRCRQPGGADQRPVCLVATTLDAVSIENATTGETIGRWAGTGSVRTD